MSITFGSGQKGVVGSTRGQGSEQKRRKAQGSGRKESAFLSYVSPRERLVPCTLEITEAALSLSCRHYPPGRSPLRNGVKPEAGRSQGSDPATCCSSTPRIQLPAVARWHAHPHGLATPIREISGPNITVSDIISCKSNQCPSGNL